MTNYAELYGRVQRKLFADVAAGGSAASLEGKVASVKEQQKLRVDSLQVAHRSGRAANWGSCPAGLVGSGA